jgi:hypothetical protein
MLDYDYSSLLLIQAIDSLPCDINLPQNKGKSSAYGIIFSSGENDRRRYKRIKFSSDLAMQYQQCFPYLQRQTTWCRIRTIDISKNGLGFYHSEQLFPKEHVKIVLHDGNIYELEVARCKRIQDNCFLIGGTLSHPLKCEISVLKRLMKA